MNRISEGFENSADAHRDVANQFRGQANNSLDLANLNANKMTKGAAVFQDPTAFKHTYSMQVTDNFGRDSTTASTMAGTGRWQQDAGGNLSSMENAVIVCPSSHGPLADTAKQSLMRQGFRAESIKIVDQQSFNGLHQNFDPNNTVVYNIQGKGEGGVSVDLSDGSYRKTDWGVGTWFGLAQVTPPPPAVAAKK